MRYRFNRNEFAGSLGDLGTILPLALGMIMVNGIRTIAGDARLPGLKNLAVGAVTGAALAFGLRRVDI